MKYGHLVPCGALNAIDLGYSGEDERRAEQPIAAEVAVLSKLIFGIAFCAVLFGLYCLLLYFQQDKLLFYRVVNDSDLADSWRPRRVDISADDVVIEGWWAENSHNPSGPVVIYFGGNAEDILRTASGAARFGASRMLFTNYRGYGGTPGRPGQKALYGDALAIYDYAVSQAGVPVDSIIVMGRSLGSGMATYIAAHRRVRGVLLITPYDSIAGVAQGHYPYVPVSFLIRHKFPSDQYARKISAPVLMLAAQLDRVVPATHAQRLHDAWAGLKQIHVLDGVGHNDIQEHPRYYPLINSFLNTPVHVNQ
jgi:pimeloyl-ACP methyl ester carboxylesterase